MSDILFLEPVFKERIWGGQKLREFGYELPYELTGECWAISSHPNGQSIIKNGRFKGQKLGQIFEENRDLFNHIQDKHFPLLTKILDANDDLSVQVHPNDSYAKMHENDLGKTECWYVLDASKDAQIIYGHRAKTKDMFRALVKKDNWDELLIQKKVKKGDFIYVPSGTIHAIGKGLCILETQQSSDTTYRLFDYHRKDSFGRERELHIDQSIEVSLIPHTHLNINPKITMGDEWEITQFIQNEFFTVEKWKIKDHYQIKNDYFKLVSVIEGKGTINGYNIHKGDHIIICSNVESIDIKGKMELIVSWK